MRRQGASNKKKGGSSGANRSTHAHKLGAGRGSMQAASSGPSPSLSSRRPSIAAIAAAGSASAAAAQVAASTTQHSHSYFPPTLEAAAARRSRSRNGRDGTTATPANSTTGRQSRSRASSMANVLTGLDPFASLRHRSGATLDAHQSQARIILAAVEDLLREQGLEVPKMPDADSSMMDDEGSSAAMAAASATEDSSKISANPTHYFGSLMVLLEQHATSASSQNEPDTLTLGAVTYLLSLLLPQLPSSVLRAKSEPASALFISLLERHADDAHVARHALEACAELVRRVGVSADTAVWSHNAAAVSHSNAPRSLPRLLQVLLVYSLDHRPRIRKVAQEGVKDTLAALYEQSSMNAASNPSATVGLPKGVNDTLVSFSLREVAQCTPKDCQVVLYLCGLLQTCIHLLAVSAASKILEAILTLVGRGTSVLMVQACRTIDALFAKAGETHLRSDDTDGAAPSSMDTSTASPHMKRKEQFLRMSAALLSALVTLKPHHQDVLATQAYVSSLRVGIVSLIQDLESTPEMHANFGATYLKQFYAQIPELVSAIAEGGLTSPKVDVAKSSTKSLSQLMKMAITPGMIRDSLREAERKSTMQSQVGSSASASTGESVAPPLYRLIEQLESFLGYRYKSCWNRILGLITDFFHAIAPVPEAHALVTPLLKQLDGMYVEALSTPQSEDPTADIRGSVETCLGAGIECVGMEKILAILPLNLPLDYYESKAAMLSSGQDAPSLSLLLSQSRSWLLALFRNHVPSESTRMEFFNDFFVPLAESLHTLEKHAMQTAAAAAAGNKGSGGQPSMESRAFASLKVSVWDLFPQVCQVLPRDLPQAFKPMAKTLVGQLNADEKKYTHATICKGLATIVRRLREIAAANEQADGEENQSKITRSHDDDEDDDDDDHDPFNDDGESEDSDDIDSDDEDAQARLHAKRAAKRKAAAQASAALTNKSNQANTSTSATAPSSSSSTRRLSHYTPAEASALLRDTISPLCKHLLPVLLNLASMPSEKAGREPILEAVQLVAAISEPNMLNAAIKKVMRKTMELLVTLQEKQQQQQSAASKEDDNAMEGVTTTNDHGQHAQQIQRAHLLLDLLAALTLQSTPLFSKEVVAFLHQILLGQLGLEKIEHGIQKRLYKILANLCNHHPTYLKEEWKSIVECLTNCAPFLHAGSLRQRLSVLRPILLRLPMLLLKDKSAAQLLPPFLGEVILATKELAVKTRDQAFDILVALGRKMLEVEMEKRNQLWGTASKPEAIFGGLTNPTSEQPMMAEFVFMVSAGVGGTSPHMQSASVLCLAKLLYAFRHELSSDIVSNMLQTVLPLFEASKSRELIKSLLVFSKVVALKLPLDTLSQFLPALASGLVVWCEEKSGRFKLKIRLLFEILMKKAGVQPIMQLVPPKHAKLIEHIRKTKEREKRQKADAWRAKRAGGGDDDEDASAPRAIEDYDAIMRDDDDDGDDVASSKRRLAKGKSGGNNMWIRDGDVDFMDASVVSKVTASNPALDASSKRIGGLKFGNGVMQDSKTGKLVISDESKSSSSSSAAANASMLDIDELDAELKGKQREKKKRRREEVELEQQQDDAEEMEKQKRGERSSTKPAVKRQQLPGQQYKSTKAGGDMKRRGLPDPYAFVPLDPMALNKRKKFTAQRRMESIVNAAKSGSQSGSSIAKAKYSRSHKNKSHKKHGGH